MSEVLDALEAAAESEDRRINGDYSIDAPATSSKRRVATVRTTISRFLDALPEEMTVHELREELERLAA